jgi:diaminohydroxyphosphoribosylaminopyrimidine deaminase/5-amino-6-(5-phosphoribosylamino)uracil reductase
MFSADDHRHMARALRLAAMGRYTTPPNPQVGCVVVREGDVVGEGYHRRAGEPHAEAVALAHAGAAARGAHLYVTLEPCRHTGRTPPCTRAIVQAGIARVVAASEDPDPRVSGHGLRELEAAGVRTGCGLMRDEARSQNPGFHARMSRGLPFVRVKLAMSLDGRTAMASGESRWITGPAARRDVQHWRALSGAVVTGVGTVLADDPSLDVRPEDMGPEARRLAEPLRQPLRVILDSAFRTPSSARTLHRDGRVIIAGAREPGPTAAELRRAAELLVIEQHAGRPSLRALLEILAAREVNDVLVEAGPLLAGAFVAAGLVDELLIYAAPTLLGSTARPLLELPEMTRMSQQRRLEIVELRSVGSDLRLRARPQTGAGPPART